MFIARMETEHFRFEAAGLREATAKKALLDGWRRHIRQAMEGRHPGHCGELRASLAMSIQDLEDYYGLTVTPFVAGECRRDGTKI